MKRLVPFFLILTLCLAAPVSAAAPSLITVTAQGRSSTMPDMATANFTISTTADAAGTATSDNNARYNRLLQALTRIGIAKSDIQTTSFNVNYAPPPKPPEVPQQGQRYGYSVYRGVSVTVNRLADVGKAIDTAVAAGITDVNGVTFDTRDKAGQFGKALRDAVTQARAHAQAMAAAGGLRIVRVRSMQEGVPTIFRPTAAPEPMMARAVPTQIEPSAVQTEATVTITYEAQ
jgi:uncharacterized protein YggE